jgi:hypothetical protein
MRRLNFGFEDRVVPLVTAIALVLPLTVASTQAVAATCSYYWAPNYTVSRVVRPAAGFLYTSTVTARLEFNTCRSTPTRTQVRSFSNTMHVEDSRADAVHQDAGGAVLEWFHDSLYDYKTVWNDTTVYRHVGNGTWTRTDYPNVIMPYNKDAAIRGFWTGCSWAGVGWCRLWYLFRQGAIAWEST